MPTAIHHEAEAVSAQPKRRQLCGARWTAVPLAFALVALAAAAVSCAPAAGSGPPSGDTSVTVIATGAPIPAATPVVLPPGVEPSMSGYRLILDDEFDGSVFNSRLWGTSLPWGNTNRDEQQYYTSDALSQGDGVLTITATKQPTRGKPYASGVINSSDRFAFTYGYTEIRAQVPAGAGLWSAFWLLSPEPGSNDEVDIMEVLGSDPSAGYAVVHYGSIADRERGLSTYRNPDFSVGFHTFAVDWEPESMIWYVDGVERYRVFKNVPSKQMYLITNLAVGGRNSWSGPPNRYTEFPAAMKIDYIRVFQRN